MQRRFEVSGNSRGPIPTELFFISADFTRKLHDADDSIKGDGLQGIEVCLGANNRISRSGAEVQRIRENKNDFLCVPAGE